MWGEIFNKIELLSQLMLVDISTEERLTILVRLKEYLGIHGSELPDKEREELISVINKIEAIHT